MGEGRLDVKTRRRRERVFLKVDIEFLGSAMVHSRHSWLVTIDRCGAGRLQAYMARLDRQSKWRQAGSAVGK